MKRNNLPSVSRASVIWCIVLLVLCSLYLNYTLGLSSGVRFDVPFTYEGDGLEYNLLTKTMIETGWWTENPVVGAPDKLEMYDYAIGNTLDFFVMKIISIFTDNYALVMNSYYILGFFLTALCSLYVFRQLRITYPVAVFGSILFPFLFYHFSRISHFNLTAYYMIPLIVLVILWICNGEPLFLKRGEPGEPVHLAVTQKGVIAAIILLISATHPYYGFFGLLFLVVATLWSASRSDTMIPLLNGIISGMLLAVFAILNRLPSLWYGFQHGTSLAISSRAPFEAEEWGLKLIQLLLPAPGHRIDFLADIARKYTVSRPLVNENVSATLGIIGSIGVVILLGWIFIREWQPIQKKFGGRRELMDQLSLFTISGILIGTIGGFSAIIALVFPVIHSYNRISLYIGFFSILAMLIILQIMYEQFRNKPYFCPVFLVLLLAVLTLGVYDQVPAWSSLTSGSDKEREQEFLDQEIYFTHVEDTMPPGASVFILPDIGGFPHSSPPGTINELDSLKPYLHTHDLKWNYPTMKGRFWDNWQVKVATSEPADLLDHLFFTGFTGLLIDGYGYHDEGEAIIEIYQNLTGIEPVISKDGRYAFFDLTGYMDEKKAGMTSPHFEEEKIAYLTTMKANPELNNPLFGTWVRENLSKTGYPDSPGSSNVSSSITPAITVIIPNGGEIWQPGSTQTLQWNYTGNPGSRVTIDALRSGSILTTIASNYPIGEEGSGAFNLTLPPYTPLGSDYRIRVTSTRYPGCTDISDAPFAISAG